jgi:hypothetical protein
MLRPAARKAHIVPALDNCSLLSLGQLCDAGYNILFEANTLSVLDIGKAILTGRRDHSTGMWHITLPSASTSTHMSHHVGKQSTAYLVAFTHATLFSSLSLSTLEKALNSGYLNNFPGLNAQSLRKFPPASVPMAKAIWTRPARTNGPLDRAPIWSQTEMTLSAHHITQRQH